jgi:hypothetical protein
MQKPKSMASADFAAVFASRKGQKTSGRPMSSMQNNNYSSYLTNVPAPQASKQRCATRIASAIPQDQQHQNNISQGGTNTPSNHSSIKNRKLRTITYQ